MGVLSRSTPPALFDRVTTIYNDDINEGVNGERRARAARGGAEEEDRPEEPSPCNSRAVREQNQLLTVPYVQETFALRALKLKPLENKLRLRSSTPTLHRGMPFLDEV